MNVAYSQIIETIDIGLVVLDRDMTVLAWNRWLEIHSGIAAKDIIGSSILNHYPNLSQTKYTRLIRSVINFGNFAYFSQKLHKYLIPLKNPHSSADYLPYMQQQCTATPLRNPEGIVTGLFIAIQDVTEYVIYENKLIEMTKIDPLTRLFNRRFLETRFLEELERANRHGSTFSVMMIDIDHFKKINDTHGHLCGDQVLRQIALLFQETVRSMDIVGRYGGEEFCCVLPEINIDNAHNLAERLRSIVESFDFPHGDGRLNITISIGIAEHSQELATLEAIIGAADDALYKAKTDGRNRVVIADKNCRREGGS